MLITSNIKVSEKYSCLCCDYNTSRLSQYNKHILTTKHLNLTTPNQKVTKHYFCECCNYDTILHTNYKKHLLTVKHLKLSKLSTVSKKVSQPIKCDICDKIYNSRPGLWNHKKKCSQKPLENSLNITDITNPSIIMNLIKENQEFKSLLIEQNKKQEELINKVIELSREPRIINNGTMTQNNNKFNLQLFLNDTCKDAITLQQFIENIQISLEDLENVGRNGYLKGISDIFINKLNTLDITKRPIHCTDVKREVIYLKEEDTWNKDDKDNTKLKNAIRTIEDKNWNKIPDWQRENPEVIHSDTPEYKMREKIMRNIADHDNIDKLREKVVKVLAKETHVDKCEDNSIMDIET